MNFQVITKFIVSIRLLLQKVGVDGFTGPRRESDVRYKFHFKRISRPYSADRDFLYYQSLLNSKLLWAMIWNNEYESAILDNKTVDFYLCPPKQCCCWVYIHHCGPLHSNNIVKGKGFSVPRKSTIQCPRLSEFFWKKMKRLKCCHSHLLFWFLSWYTWN